ncbi:MAG TPA: hypothetical protein VL022_05615 [Moheibacter sp.]|nr:hypothetical protein [Moheibacter sp.]
MNNYYNELSQLSILEQEINRFATSLQNKKAGCFTHRFEALLNVLPNEFRNQVNFRNKIQDYIKKSNYEKDVKDYVLQVFLSFFEPIEIKVPNSLRNVVEKNESYNKAMIEGYLNFEKAMIEHYKETSYTSPLSFDVYTQNHNDYISEFYQKRNEIDKLTLQYELEYYRRLKDVAGYVFNGIDYKNPPTDEVRELLDIDVEILKNKNPKKVYDNCFWIVDFLEQQTAETLPLQQPETDKPDEVTKELHNHIFKGNAFEVFEKYHINKSLAENSKTDLSLLFQLFEKDNLFVETVELKHYIKWLNKTYGYGLTTIKRANIKSKPNIQRTNDYKEYKRTTLKQP